MTKPAVFGVMMPFTLGTESMMPVGDQKWLVSLSRMLSHAGRAPLGFFAGTSPGPLRPGTIADALAGTANSSDASTARRDAGSPADMATAERGAAARSGAVTRAEHEATSARRRATT